MRTAALLGLVLAVTLGATPAAQRPAGRSTDPPHEPHPALDGSAPVVAQELAAQVMLDRAGFSPGEIDGLRGPNLKRALVAFQAAQHLNGSAALDADTWQRLGERSGSQPPLTAYTITDADVAGPFTPDIPTDLMAQAALESLSYRTPLEALGERFHSSPRLLSTLNPGASFDKAGERVMVPNVLVTASPAATAAKPVVTVIVTKDTSTLTVEDDGGAVLFEAPVTSGSEHDPLPIGTWKVNGVQQDPAFHYNPALFWDANPSHSKSTIAPGPNNPVGTVWIDLNKEHYGIHGTPEPSKIGHVESHGCVRLTNWDAQRVAGLVKAGTKVIFR